MTTKDTNPLEMEWKKEIDNKSFEDLAKIIANKEDYQSEYVEMVQKELESHSDYSEEKANAIIESEREKRKTREEQNDQSMSGWLMLFMFGLIVGSVYNGYNTIKTFSPAVYDYNLPLMWCDIATIVGMAIFAVYTFISLYKRWPNAIYLTYFYLGISILLNIMPLLQLANGVNPLENPVFLRGIWGIVVAIIWYLYFKYSKRINARYPLEERHLLKRDKFIISGVIAIPVLLAIWSIFASPSSPSLSVAEGMDLSDIDQSSYLIDESTLNDNEITDGLSIFRLPQGVKYEAIDFDEVRKIIVLTDEKDEIFYEIRTISGVEDQFTSLDFENTWSQQQDSTMIAIPQEIIHNDVNDVDAGKWYRKIVRYQMDVPMIWDYSAIYDHMTHKYCLISAWYSEKTIVPIDEIIDGIRFKQ